MALLFGLLTPPAYGVQAETSTSPILRVVPGGAAAADCGGGWDLADAETSLRPCDLQYALQTRTDSGSWEVWVKTGTYYPTNGVDRTVSFNLKSGVSIYGGFAGTETSRDQRSPDASLTVLSGNIGDQSLATDNSYHVVYGLSVDSTTVLDGFTITGGYANDEDNYGGGMVLDGARPRLSHLIVTRNFAQYEGGGIYQTAMGSGEYPNLTDVIISENTSESGGGIYILRGKTSFTRVTFEHNTATAYGGGLYTGTSLGGLAGDNTPLLTSVTFSENTAGHSGGAMYNSAGFEIGFMESTNVFPPASPVLTNVTFNRNTTTDPNGQSDSIFNQTAGTAVYTPSPKINNSILWGQTTHQIGGDTSQTLVTYSDVQGGFSGTGNINQDPLLGALGTYGGFAPSHPLLPGSPAIDAGDPATCPEADARKVTHPQGAGCDLGAFESRAFTLVKTGGDDQHPSLYTPFISPLVVTVASVSGDPVDGSQVTFTAPAGGASAALGSSPVTVTGGQARITPKANGVLGEYQITASLVGLAPVAFTVTNEKISPEIHLSASASISPPGQPVSFTAQVSSPTTESGQPTGRVTITISGEGSHEVNLDANGTAVYQAGALPLGEYQVSASYAGDASFSEASSASIKYQVGLLKTYIPTIIR